ncbi:5-formyltetrahydrofolate cyclo-ligase [Natronospora cellulosivora (SeqCode)]
MEKGDLVLSKEKLRNKYLDIRKGFSKEKVNTVSKKIFETFIVLPYIKRDLSFLIYYSFRNEIITTKIIRELLERKKDVYLPYIRDDKKELEIGQIENLKTDIKSGMWGIKEPLSRDNIPLSKIDIVVVPGLLFSRNGYRIGYGGGYYDKLLAKKDNNTISIGLSFDDFLFDELPNDRYDLPVDIILTEKKIIYIRGDINEFI